MGKRGRGFKRFLAAAAKSLLGEDNKIVSKIAPYLGDALAKTASFGNKLGVSEKMTQKFLDTALNTIHGGGLQKAATAFNVLAQEYWDDELQPNATIPSSRVADRTIAFLGDNPNSGIGVSGKVLFGGTQPHPTYQKMTKPEKDVSVNGYMTLRQRKNAMQKMESRKGMLIEEPRRPEYASYAGAPYWLTHSGYGNINRAHPKNYSEFGWWTRPVGPGTNINEYSGVPGFDAYPEATRAELLKMEGLPVPKKKKAAKKGKKKMPKKFIPAI